MILRPKRPEVVPKLFSARGAAKPAETALARPCPRQPAAVPNASRLTCTKRLAPIASND